MITYTEAIENLYLTIGNRQGMIFGNCAYLQIVHACNEWITYIYWSYRELIFNHW